MWDVFPIQCEGDSGKPLQTIDPSFTYVRHSEVQVEVWKNVSTEVKVWAQMIWADEFDCQRTPLASGDLLAWIPGQATLTARRGYWVDAHQSKPAALINANYVHSMLRGHRLAEKMITSLCHEVCRRWSIHTFLFEVQTVPTSLLRRKAQPIASFQYVWVPTAVVDPNWVVLKPKEVRTALRGKRGFHSTTYPGMIGYRHARTNRIVILDSHDDVVYFDRFADLPTIPGDSGHHCRVFHSMGPTKVFVENMYFDDAGSAFTLLQ